MKIETLKTFWIILLFTLIFISACSKEDNNITATIPIGSITGNVMLYDKNGVANYDFGDLRIDLIDSTKTSKSVSVDSIGFFYIDSIPLGTLLFKIDKPGYGVIDTISFDHQKNFDTITTISLAVELPFSFDHFYFNSSPNKVYYQHYSSYQSNETYMVGTVLCFSKDTNVSINHCDFFNVTGSYTNVSVISWQASAYLTNKYFTDYGFHLNDRIYAVCYPIIHQPFTLYEDPIPSKNFKIISYKWGNSSAVSSFVLY